MTARTILTRGLTAAALLAGGVWLWVNLMADHPERWHVSPAEIVAHDPANGYLVAPPGAVPVPPDKLAPVWALTPHELFALIDHHALAQPRTIRLAGGPFDLHATYVARSPIWGFPDYITVKTLPAPGGATLIIWSRARYGSSDLGVNKARVESWLAALPRL